MPKTKETAAVAADPFDIEESVNAVAGRLDRERAFGTVQGESKKRYFQDGRYFDYAGILIEET